MNTDTESIGFNYVEVYCMDCGYRIGYNGCKLLSQPSKCKMCGGEMIHNEHERESFGELGKLLINLSKIIKEKSSRQKEAT